MNSFTMNIPVYVRKTVFAELIFHLSEVFEVERNFTVTKETRDHCGNLLPSY